MRITNPNTVAARAYLFTLFDEGCTDDMFPTLWYFHTPAPYVIWRDLRCGSRRALNFVLDQLASVGYDRDFMLGEAKRAAQSAGGDVRKVVAYARRRPIRLDEDEFDDEDLTGTASAPCEGATAH